MIDLEFLAQQQKRILAELAEMRLQLRTDTASVRDDLNVLTAMVLRLENSTRNQGARTDHAFERIRNLEETDQ